MQNPPNSESKETRKVRGVLVSWVPPPPPWDKYALHAAAEASTGLNQAAPSWWMVFATSWRQDALHSSLTLHKMLPSSGILTSYFIFWNLSLEETAVYPLLPFPPISAVVEHRAGHGASLYYISQLLLSGCDPGVKFWPQKCPVAASGNLLCHPLAFACSTAWREDGGRWRSHPRTWGGIEIGVDA